MYGILLQNLSDDELLRLVDRCDPVIKELAERLEYSNDQLGVYEAVRESMTKEEDIFNDGK